MKLALCCSFLRIAYEINFVNIFSGCFTQWSSSCEIISLNEFLQLCFVPCMHF